VSEAKTSGDEQRIRGRIESRAAALRAKDIEGVMAHYASDALSFDLAPPLQHERREIRRGLVGAVLLHGWKPSSVRRPEAVTTDQTTNEGRT